MSKRISPSPAPDAKRQATYICYNHCQWVDDANSIKVQLTVINSARDVMSIEIVVCKNARCAAGGHGFRPNSAVANTAAGLSCCDCVPIAERTIFVTCSCHDAEISACAAVKAMDADTDAPIFLCASRRCEVCNQGFADDARVVLADKPSVIHAACRKPCVVCERPLVKSATHSMHICVPCVQQCAMCNGFINRREGGVPTPSGRFFCTKCANFGQPSAVVSCTDGNCMASAHPMDWVDVVSGGAARTHCVFACTNIKCGCGRGIFDDKPANGHASVDERGRCRKCAP